MGPYKPASKESRANRVRQGPGSVQQQELVQPPIQTANVGRSIGKGEGEYLLGRTVGEGTFGKVKLATQVLTGEKVAIKILDKSRIVDLADVRRVTREIKILKRNQHPNVIQLYEVVDSPTHIYLVMEYCDGGEMFDYIVSHQRIQEQKACWFFHQIVDGVEYFHNLEVTHRDLKPENLLLQSSIHGWIVKVVDFGLSNLHEGGVLLSTACGSPCYAAPEMIAGKKYWGPKADIWSMGIILFAMVCGFLPFEDSNTSLLYKKILSGKYHLPSWVSSSLRDLVANVLNTDPDARYDVPAIRRHPWYRRVDMPVARPLDNTEQAAGEGYDEEVLAELAGRCGLDRAAVAGELRAGRHTARTAGYRLLAKRNRRRLEKEEFLHGQQGMAAARGPAASASAPAAQPPAAAQAPAADTAAAEEEAAGRRGGRGEAGRRRRPAPPQKANTHPAPQGAQGGGGGGGSGGGGELPASAAAAAGMGTKFPDATNGKVPSHAPEAARARTPEMPSLHPVVKDTAAEAAAGAAGPGLGPGMALPVPWKGAAAGSGGRGRQSPAAAGARLLQDLDVSHARKAVMDASAAGTDHHSDGEEGEGRRGGARGEESSVAVIDPGRQFSPSPHHHRGGTGGGAFFAAPPPARTPPGGGGGRVSPHAAGRRHRPAAGGAPPRGETAAAAAAAAGGGGARGGGGGARRASLEAGALPGHLAGRLAGAGGARVPRAPATTQNTPRGSPRSSIASPRVIKAKFNEYSPKRSSVMDDRLRLSSIADETLDGLGGSATSKAPMADFPAPNQQFKERFVLNGPSASRGRSPASRPPQQQQQPSPPTPSGPRPASSSGGGGRPRRGRALSAFGGGGGGGGGGSAAPSPPSSRPSSPHRAGNPQPGATSPRQPCLRAVAERGGGGGGGGGGPRTGGFGHWEGGPAAFRVGAAAAAADKADAARAPALVG